MYIHVCEGKPFPPPIIIGPLSKDIKSEREGHLSAIVKDTRRDFLTVCKVAKSVG